jgi:uncharacterized protein
MIRAIVGTTIVLCLALTACTRRESAPSQIQDIKPTATNQPTGMKSMIAIVEIPTTDFSRATKFYKAILNTDVQEVDMEGVKIGMFSNAGEGISVQLIHGGDYKPSADGVLVYLNGGDDLQKVADKIVANGGSMVLPKSAIGPDMGFYAVFIDTEGNKLGLYSVK